jgi:nucleotide-binding universal stress UspA family protein
LALAREFDAELTLLRVVDVTQAGIGDLSDARQPLLDQLQDDLQQEAGAYLAERQSTLRQQGYKVAAQVGLQPRVAEAIVDEATRIGADAIVMSTHGRGGLSRWLFGSVAEKVLRQAPCPILLVRVDQGAENDWEIS